MKTICAGLAFLFAFVILHGLRFQGDTSSPPDTHVTLMQNGGTP